MSNKPNRHADGFTLVETLVAGIILALSAAALGVIVRQALRSLAIARGYQQAAELLDLALTKIDTIGPTGIQAEGPTEGVFDPPHDQFAWSATVSPMAEGHLYEVTVRITWRAPSGALRSTEAQTFINDPPGRSAAELGWDDL